MGLDFTEASELDWLSESRESGDQKSQLRDFYDHKELAEIAREELVDLMAECLLEIDDSRGATEEDARQAAVNILNVKLTDEEISNEAEKAWRAKNHVESTNEFMKVFNRRWARRLIDRYDKQRGLSNDSSKKHHTA